MKKTLIYICAICLLYATQAMAQVDRSKAPKAGPAPKINIGKPESFTLDNGMKVIVVANNKLPRVSFQFTLDNDPIQEKDAAGYVQIAGDLMRKGSEKYSKDEINESIDFIGATFATYSTGFYASSLTKHVDKLLEVASNVVMKPTFPEAELEKLKKEQLSNLAANKASPDAIAGNVGQVIRYGKDHPYGEIVTEETVNNITIDLVKNYYNTYFKPNKGYLIVVGDIDAKKAKELTKKYFGSWAKGDVPTHNYDKPQAPEKPQVVLVNKEGAVQSVVNIHYPIEFVPGNDDAIAASVMANILGGSGFSGRLMQNIREDKGYTYGARASLSSDEEIGSFNAFAKVRNEVTDSAVVEFLYEMNRIRDEKVGAEELDRIKKQMAGSFARSLESPQTVARFALNIARYNLPADYYEKYLQRLSAVTAEDVQRTAKKYIKPNNSYIQIVGSVNEVGEKMAAFGEVTEYDAYGKVAQKVEVEGAADMTVDKVIAKYLETMGGKEHLSTIKNSYSSFVGSTPMGELSLVVAMEDGKKAVIQSMGGQVMSKQVYTADKLKITSPMGAQEITGDKYKPMQHMAILYPELDYAKNGYSLKLLGTAEVSGTPVYQVEVTTPGGEKEIHSYGADSGLFLKLSSAKTGTQYFTDYKKVSGIMVPHKLIIETPAGNMECILKEVRFNEALDADLFK